ncbi:efflux RND transporter periplasmic adaptor subunit [Aquiflexum gelatinilyticum]|uniref:Efflux RND transporter periplasmic adaptor subunit n=1 Tax=Aquiflexum gelatinilyticum TaxID=2961943 RepID=A0A9X2SZF3_9BACT|nr:efflux RND transporter periplasmic adaptor subunit [Aquiflexum gelatinilyticum]MCR9013866.1 efflux RND transporter periplasmic adaptor subunit [Aquiflexum gelatinilyticum]
MKKLLYILIPLVIVAAIAFKLFSNKQTATERVFHYNKDQNINVMAQKLTKESVQQESAFTGAFVAQKESNLSGELQGKVNAVMVENGDPVRKGQVLVQLDNTMLVWQQKAIEVQIEGLESDLKRYKILVENDAIQGIQLEKTEMALKSASVQHQSLQEQIKKTSIRAPFDGIVTAKMTEVGDFAAPGKPLVQVSNLKDLNLLIQVSEQDLSLFQNGQTVDILVPVINMETTGKVSMVGVKSNPGNSFPVELKVSNSNDLKIKAGFLGEVSISDPSMQNRILIPSSAIVGSDLEPKVYLIKNGKAQLTTISISKRIQNKVLVDSGLQEGDTLVIGGVINVFEGANLTPIF